MRKPIVVIFVTIFIDKLGFGIYQSFDSVASNWNTLSGFMHGIEYHVPFLTGSLVIILCIWLAGLIRPAAVQTQQK